MTDNNKSGQRALSKKIIAFMAVLMMIVSPMAIVVAVGDTHASESNDVELSSPISLYHSDKGWAFENQGQKNITFDETTKTITFDNVNITFNTMSYYAVGVFGLDSTTDNIKLVFVGENHITLNYTPDENMTPPCIIDAQSCSIEISGYDDKSSLKLELASSDSSLSAYLIKSERIAINDLGIEGGFKSPFSETMIINGTDDITISGSKINADVGASQGSIGIKTTRGTVSIINASDVTIDGSNCSAIFHGIYVGDSYSGIAGNLNIVNSTLKVPLSTNAYTSIGISVNYGNTTIVNSDVFVQGTLLAMCTYDGNFKPVLTDAFEGVMVEGSESTSEPYDFKEIKTGKGLSIDLKYKTVQITDQTKHTITFLSNGGIGDVPAPMDAKRGDICTVPDPSFTKEGFAFDYWSGSDGKKYLPGDSFTMGYKDLVLTAMWKDAPKHTLDFDANGGSGPLPDPVVLAEGESFTVPDCGLIKEGFAFVGWMDNNGTYYLPGDSFTMGFNDDVLTAQWAEVITHKLSFDANGGTGNVPKSVDIEVGCAYAIPECTLSKVGFVFDGWMGSDGIKYNAGDKFVMGDEDVVLTAQWTEAPTHTLSFDKNGGTGNVPKSIILAEGTSCTIPVCILTKDGFTFDGWMGSDGIKYNAGDKFVMGDKDVVLTAQWKEVPRHTLSFDKNGGIGDVPDTMLLKNGDTFVIPVCSLIKDGFVFDGWLGSDGKKYKAGDVFTMGDSDVVLTAQWKEVPRHTLSFDANGGIGNVPDTQLLKNGETFVIPVCTLTKEGFTFDGWLGSDGKKYKAGDVFTMGESDVVLTAQWKAVVTHTIFFDGNGADRGTMPSIALKAGETFKLPRCGFSKFGYSFGGWTVDGVNIIFKGTEITMGDSDVTYKVVWNKNGEDMSIDSDPKGKAEVDVDASMKTLTIKIDGFTVFIDEATVQKMQGHTFYIQIRMVNSDEIYEIVAMIDGESQKVPFEGDMIITLPFDPLKGTPSVYVKDGTSETPVDFIIGDETLSFKVGGSCECVVKYTAEPEPVPPVVKENNNTWAIVGIIIMMVMVALGIFLLAYRNRQQRKH